MLDEVCTIINTISFSLALISLNRLSEFIAGTRVLETIHVGLLGSLMNSSIFIVHELLPLCGSMGFRYYYALNIRTA